MYKNVLLVCSLLVLISSNCKLESSPKPGEFKLNSAQFGLTCTIHLKLFTLSYHASDIAESITHSNAEYENTFTQWSPNDTLIFHSVHTYFEFSNHVR